MYIIDEIAEMNKRLCKVRPCKKAPVFVYFVSISF